MGANGDPNGSVSSALGAHGSAAADSNASVSDANGLGGNSNTTASNGNVIDPNNPVYQGVFYAQGNAAGPSIYISKQPLSCDSNQVAPGQAVLRIDLSSAAQAQYTVGTAFNGTGTPVATVGDKSFDGNCMASGDQNFVAQFNEVSLAGSNVTSGTTSAGNSNTLGGGNVLGANNGGQTTDGSGVATSPNALAASPNDLATSPNNLAGSPDNLATSPNSFTGYTGTMLAGSVMKGSFTVVTCPGADPFAQADAQCGQAESCGPIAATCSRP